MVNLNVQLSTVKLEDNWDNYKVIFGMRTIYAILTDRATKENYATMKRFFDY